MYVILESIAIIRNSRCNGFRQGLNGSSCVCKKRQLCTKQFSIPVSLPISISDAITNNVADVLNRYTFGVLSDYLSAEMTASAKQFLDITDIKCEEAVDMNMYGKRKTDEDELGKEQPAKARQSILFTIYIYIINHANKTVRSQNRSFSSKKFPIMISEILFI